MNRDMLTPILVRGLHLFFIAALLALLANVAAPAQAASPVNDTANAAYNTPVTINVLANDVDNLDAVFANIGQVNRRCLGDGAGNFAGGCVDVSTNTNDSSGVALGDLNGDGDLDVIFANIDQLKGVCLGNGAGGFTGCADVGGERASTDVALGLVNGDGSRDAVISNNGELNRVMWGDGTGGFSGGSNVGAGARFSFGVALGDLNGDSNLDVVFANNGDRNRRCLGDGAGGLNCANASSDLNNSRGVALGNINNTVDSDLDAVFANNGQPNQRCLGDGAGGFNCANIGGDTNNTRGVALGDLNGDGNLDAVFANATGQQNRRCLGDAAGNFTGGCADVSGDTNNSLAVALGDLNGDGDLDAVFANRDQVNRRCLGNGAGGFACADVSADTNSSRGVALELLGLDVSSVAVTVAPANGAAVVNPDGSITYTPNPGFSGVDTFTYSVEGSTATVTVNVRVPVGGIIVPVSKFELLAPWLGLAALASLAALTVALVRRRIA